MEELRAIHERVRRLEALPHANLMAVMEEELRVIRLGELAGAEGKALASAILDEFERLHAAREARGG